MSDINDFNDVSEFETPTRHPTDIQKELEKLSDDITNAIFEGEIFDEFVEKYPEEFTFQIGESIAMLLGDRAQRYRNELLKGFDSGIEQLTDMEIDQE